MNKVLSRYSLVGCLVGVSSFGCSSSDDVSSSSIVPDQVAVSSVTASKTGSGVSASTLGKVSALSYQTSASSISARLAHDNVADCLAGLAAPSPATTSVSCYGPRLFTKYHPDSSSATASQLFEGDLGIWSSKEGEEACSSAKANALIGDVGAVINANLEIMAGVACAAAADGQDLAGPGDRADLTDLINSNLAGSSLTEASIKFLRENSGDGTKTYLTTLLGTLAGTPVTLYLTNTYKASDGTSSGKINGWVQMTDAMDSKTKRWGFSLTYGEGATTTNYVFRSMISDEVTTTEPSFFGSTGDIDFTLDGFAKDGRYGRAEINHSTGLGAIYFAWQAGPNDGYARVIQLYARANEGSDDTAISYFGFGPEVSESTVGDISGMICNWAGPGNLRTVNSKVQAQVMTRSASGIFAATTDYISYAPTNSCNHVATSPDFQWSTSAAGSYTDFGSITNRLVTYGDAAVGAIPSVAEPIYEDGDALIAAARAVYADILVHISELRALAVSSADSATTEATRATNQTELDEIIEHIDSLAGNSEFAE
ncbi:MAG: hypothetical protein AAB425_00315, partial [Bdellovibrionota bacterium]